MTDAELIAEAHAYADVGTVTLPFTLVVDCLSSLLPALPGDKATTLRDELKIYVRDGLLVRGFDQPEMITDAIFSLIEAHAGGCVVVPRVPTELMIAAGCGYLPHPEQRYMAMRKHGDAYDETAGMMQLQIAASPYAPEAKP